MNPFQYVRAADAPSAIGAFGKQDAPARFLAGGTNLIDLMRQGVERPRLVVDISRLPLSEIEDLPNGGLRIGAMVRNSHLAEHRAVRERFPLLEHGDDRRQRLAADPLLLLLRQRRALQ
jgi:xanthine dehydrogenase YagS FAD-binding subunit